MRQTRFLVEFYRNFKAIPGKPLMNCFLCASTRLVVFGFSLAYAQPLAAQVAGQAQPEKVYTYVEQMPQPVGGGGATAVVALIQQRVGYPLRAIRDHAEGRVFVGFTVTPTGSITDAAVVKGFRPDCDSAVLAAVQQLPPFEPGRQAGRAVPVRFTAPVTFRLQAPAPASASVPDSVQRVYTYVQFMPKYRGEEGTTKLTADLLRAFRAASKAGGCTVPDFPVYVTFTVGPSGVIYDVQSINNRGSGASQVNLGTEKPMIISIKGGLQRLPAPCEAALVAAVRQLPRLTPGAQGDRKVAVSYTLKLIGPDR